MGGRAGLRRLIAALAWRFARSRWGGRLVGLVFARLSFLLPVRRVIEPRGLIAFHHPAPAQEVHILIVPKKALAGVATLGEQDGALLREVLLLAGEIAEELRLPGFQLIVNAGGFQEVPQLHFHLLLGDEPALTK